MLTGAFLSLSGIEQSDLSLDDAMALAEILLSFGTIKISFSGK